MCASADVCNLPSDGGSSGGSVTDAEIKALTEELYTLDTNNVMANITIDIQGQTSSGSSTDEAPNP